MNFRLNFLIPILLFFALTSCAQSVVKNRDEGINKEADILIESEPSEADIFIYPSGIIAKTPFYASALELESATIEASKEGYETKSVFIQGKRKFLIFQTFFGNLMILPLYPFAVLNDLVKGWDLERPAEQITIKLQKK